jgi:tetratricopeptide (TPR) repeat protein
LANVNNNQIERYLAPLIKQLQSGNLSGLLQKATKLTQMAPKSARTHDFLGVVNASLGRHKECIEAHARALELMPANADIRHRYAQALQRGGRYEEAIIEYERVLYHRPGDFRAIRGKASAQTDLGKLDDALKTLSDLDKKMSSEPMAHDAQLALATSFIRLAPDAHDPIVALERIAPLAEDESGEPSLRINAYFQMGRVYEKLKRYDDAFASWAKTKSLKRLEWDPDEHSRRVDRLIECWSEDCGVPSADSDGSRLVYILGMMRSGTSLTEQMVAQVDGVTPGGEMNAVSRRVAEVERTQDRMFRPLPLTRARYSKPVMDKIARDAWKMYNEVARQGRITDKQPFNCFFVPLIARMFPGCKIIHCVRDPQDCCLSNYMQSFARPHPQTNELYWLGRYYRDYERMMDAWRSLSLPNMMDLHYEQTVADPEGQSRRVAEFLGVDWSERMLNYHKSDRSVRTASREQVRKPIYKSSVKKYELYAKHLGDLRRGLGIEADSTSTAEQS